MRAVAEEPVPGGAGALVTLYGLRVKASLRRMRRSFATPKGMLFAGLGVLMLVFWLGPLIARGFVIEPGDPAEIRGYVPYALIFFLIMALLTSVGERAIYFSPAEINMLFSGPFSRRQLVLYRIGTIATGIMLSSLLFALFLFPQMGSFLSAYLGAFAALLMVQLVSMFMVMLGERVGTHLTKRLRWGLGLGILALVGSGAVTALGPVAIEDPQELLEAIRSGPGGRILELVLAPYAWTFTAPTLGVLLIAFGSAMALNGLLVAAILALDANYLETAAGVSERIYTNIQRAQRTGVAVADLKYAQRRVPRLPHLGGAGTIAWRQLTTARCSSMSTVVIILVMAVTVSLIATSGAAEVQVWTVAGMMVFWLSLILSGVLRFDFRGDLDVLETLKAMPMHPYGISAGQILVPTLVLTVVQTLALAPPLVMQERVAFLPVAALFALPVNGLLYTIENIAFLLYPVRFQGQTTTDISFLGRQVLVFLVKMLILAACIGVATAVGGVLYILSGMAAAGLAAAWCVLVAQLAALLPYLSWAFQRFDPSQGLPE